MRIIEKLREEHAQRSNADPDDLNCDDSGECYRDSFAESDGDETSDRSDATPVLEDDPTDSATDNSETTGADERSDPDWDSDSSTYEDMYVTDEDEEDGDEEGGDVDEKEMDGDVDVGVVEKVL